MVTHEDFVRVYVASALKELVLAGFKDWAPKILRSFKVVEFEDVLQLMTDLNP